MDVRIDTDSIVAKSEREHQIRRLPANTGKLKQRIHGSRHLPSVFLKDAPACLHQISGFRVVKPDRKYQLFYFRDWQ
jgi:hypothetical protein